MKIYTLLVFMLFVFFSNRPKLVAQSDRSIDWKVDIDYLKLELPKRHKNLFFKYSQADFNESLDSLRVQTDVLNNFEVSIKLQQIISRIGDSHTSIDNKLFLSKEKLLAMSSVWFSDGIYVVSVDKANKELLGGKLKSINGFTIQRIIDSLSTLIVVDNNACLRRSIPNFFYISQILNYFGFMPDSIATVEVENSQNMKIASTLSAKAYVDSLVVDTGPPEKPYYREFASSFFSEKYFENDSIYFVQYNTCWSKELEQEYGNKAKAANLPSFITFYQAVLKTLNEKPIKKMIFDMRYNSGGSSLQAMDFIDQLGRMEVLDKRKKLYVAIGRRTFSSAILNANDFKRSTKAILIGEETAGRPNHYGEVKKLVLPSSRLSISYSTKYFKRVSGDPPSLEPDIKCELSFLDYLKGIDPVYQYVKSAR